MSIAPFCCRTLLHVLCLSVPGIAGCGGDDEPTENVADAAVDAGRDAQLATDVTTEAVDVAAAGTPANQLPPQGQKALEAWLAAGHYKSWRCEASISPPRPNGAHSHTRVCSNAALLASKSGDYPIGAASVKELYSGRDPASANGYAVGVKVASGRGAADWYWYERIGTNPNGTPIADGDGTRAALCASCHDARADRDNVFVRAE